MASRPKFIQLAPRDLDTSRNGPPSPADMPSPRAGDAPPALSPLDAFALQSRLLAQRLEAGNRNGQRMSRLEPVTIANALAQHRAGYNATSPERALPLKRSPSSATPDSSLPTHTLIPNHHRPVSHYPTIQAFDDAESIMTIDSFSTIEPVQEADEDEAEAYNTSRSRDLSPETTAARDTLDPRQGLGISKASSSGSSTPIYPNGLAPPRSPRPARSPGAPRSGNLMREKLSIRPVRMNAGDEPGSPHSDYFPPERKPSLTAGPARPRSPFSPVFAPPRSPSVASDYSQIPRGSINFSRPMSRTERRPSYEASIRSNREGSIRPSMDALSLHESIAGSPQAPSAPWLDSGTPNSMTDEDSSRPSTPSGATSYIYSKYSLPRGRSVARDAAAGQAEPTHKFEWEQPVTGTSNVHPIRHLHGSSALANALPMSADDSVLPESTLPTPKFPPMPRTHSMDETSTMRMRSHRSDPSFPPPSDPSFPPLTASTSSASSARTIMPAKPLPFRPGPSSIPSSSPHAGSYRFGGESRGSPSSPDPSTLSDALRNLTPEAHLTKGIDYHENGELQRSTYHLRLAAKGGNPTAMLLYALACRHGWGMRPNQAEGVLWLRKAVDGAGLEVAGDETLLPHEASGKDQHANAVIARRAHKAQLALAIYELGVSYMNGWGIAQDKPLALRCFEIAGGWGDADALAETGFCYAKGVGTKKDLNKAADFYRRAADKGVGMAGNSWIYKEKYLAPSKRDDERKGRADKAGDRDAAKRRDKSRTRTIFGMRRDKEKEKDKDKDKDRQLAA